MSDKNFISQFREFGLPEFVELLEKKTVKNKSLDALSFYALDLLQKDFEKLKDLESNKILSQLTFRRSLVKIGFSDIVEKADIIYDEKKLCIYCNKKTVSLKRKHLLQKILSLYLRQENKLFSKRELYCAIWKKKYLGKQSDLKILAAVHRINTLFTGIKIINYSNRKYSLNKQFTYAYATNRKLMKDKVTLRRGAIINILQKCDKITVRELSSIFNLSERTLERDMRSLHDAGLVKVGTSRKYASYSHI